LYRLFLIILGILLVAVFSCRSFFFHLFIIVDRAKMAEKFQLAKKHNQTMAKARTTATSSAGDKVIGFSEE